MIPLVPLWVEYARLLKPNGAVVLTATQPFAAALVMSRPRWFRHEWVWDRGPRTSGHLDAKRRPMRRHELVLVFGPRRVRYYPIKTPGPEHRSSSPGSRSEVYGRHDARRTYESAERYPVDVLAIPAVDARRRIHPAQKPVALMEYLIRTYTNPGDTVLDNCFGSGTTGVACVRTGRRFVGIERDEAYFTAAAKRIGETAANAGR